jgi:hypothetical protein
MIAITTTPRTNNNGASEGGTFEEDHFRSAGVSNGIRGHKCHGADQAAEARRHSRYVGPVCRYHRRPAARPLPRWPRKISAAKCSAARSRWLLPTISTRPDLSANIARDMLDNQGVEAIIDVAASATALAVRARSRARATRSSSSTARLDPPQQRGLRPLYGALCVRHLRAGQCDRSRHREAGLDTWFFLTADYAFGADLEKDTGAVVTKAGGKVLGSVKHPLNSSDFSSFLLQAQSSKAKVVGLANAGGDTITAIKQAAEFGLTQERRPEAVAAAGLHLRHRQRRSRYRAGPDPGGSVLLGSQ